jgi:DNA repair exonuclease SbcCD nuclease subunit
MILAHFSDIHISERHPYYSLDDQLQALMGMTETAQTQGADAAVIAGDLFDRQLPTATERQVACAWIRELSTSVPVVIVRGNHDGCGELGLLHGNPNCADGFRIISPLCPVSTIFVCIPWPRRSVVEAHMAKIGKEVSCDDIMRDLLSSVGATIRDGHPERRYTVVVGHLEVAEAKLCSGQPTIGRCDLPVSVGDLQDLGADYVALGHIHQHQTLARGVVYGGSTWQTRWGEDTDKGCTLVDLYTGEIERIQSKLPRMVDACMDGDFCAAYFEGRHVRLGYRAQANEATRAHREAQERRDMILRGGALSCRIVPTVSPSAIARNPEVAAASSMQDKLRTYWLAGDGEPARSEEINSKLRDADEWKEGS